MEKDDEMLMDEELLNENRVIIEEEDYEANQVLMTPGQMIFRRFIRNRLAVTGICAIIFMFIFCFIGPFFMPYTETELFYVTDVEEHPDSPLKYYRTKAMEKNGVSATVYYDMHTGEVCETVPTDIILLTRAKPSADHLLGTTECTAEGSRSCSVLSWWQSRS